MKIGILTFHRAYNYGAFLQCYSLQHKLREQFPDAQVEVVDYASERMMQSYSLSARERIFGQASAVHQTSLPVAVKRLIKGILNMKNQKAIALREEKRRKNFAAVIDSLPLSGETLVSDSEDAFLRYISGKYDVLVVGSDAVWNDYQTSIPNLYYLHGVRDCMKFSYAASTYGMDYSGKSEQERGYIARALSDFRFVGVRDTVSEAYVSEITGGAVRATHTCDPSVFLDLNNVPCDREQLKQKLIDKGVDFSRPIVGLMCSEWLARQVREHFGDRFQLVSVYAYTQSCDVFLDELTPFEWAHVFSFFDVTVTHYFHGTLFSLKNGTLTYPIERKSGYNQKYETKIQDVMKRLGLYQDFYKREADLSRQDWQQLAYDALNCDKTQIRERLADALDRESRTALPFFDSMKQELADK